VIRPARPAGARRIIRNPKICGGEPTLAGTRVPVSSVVVQWRFDPDLARVLAAFPHLDASDIDRALSYYAKHRAEIDRLIDEDDRAANSSE
jgi:uncharacterized protein (DUF433 family)